MALPPLEDDRDEGLGVVLYRGLAIVAEDQEPEP